MKLNTYFILLLAIWLLLVTKYKSNFFGGGLYSLSPFSNVLILGVVNRSPLLYICTKILHPSFHKILCVKEYSENVISHVLE